MDNLDTPLKRQLAELRLPWMLDNHEHELAEAARRNRTQHDLLGRLVAGEIAARHDRTVHRRVKQSKLPAVRTLQGFDFAWPTSINQDHVRHLFTLGFMREKANVVFVGGVGLGKTHLACALAHEACARRMSVFYTSAVGMVNNLFEARQRNGLAAAVRRYAAPDLLVVDELGYLPFDKVGAELIFQVVCERYEKASTIITANRIYKEWTPTFANDAAVTSAILDRINHHCETVVIKGKSYRLKDRIQDDEPTADEAQ